jgi:mannose-6-phosphate isomerase-like protein (cupin superfamily)
MKISTNIDGIQSLISMIQISLRSRTVARDAIGNEAAGVLSLLEPLPVLDGTFSRSTHPSIRHLNAAFESGSAATTDLLDAIRPVALDLPWRYSYALRDDAPGLGNNMAFAELIGPEAPYKSDRVCVGLTLIGPEIIYPSHSHPAVELYYVVAGKATWVANGVSRLIFPGEFILHGSQVVHAMLTTSEPLLAVYTWSGKDVISPSVYLVSG